MIKPSVRVRIQSTTFNRVKLYHQTSYFSPLTTVQPLMHLYAVYVRRRQRTKKTQTDSFINLLMNNVIKIIKTTCNVFFFVFCFYVFSSKAVTDALMTVTCCWVLIYLISVIQSHTCFYHVYQTPFLLINHVALLHRGVVTPVFRHTFITIRLVH